MQRDSVAVAYIGNFRPSWSTETHVAASLEALGHRVRRLQEDELRWSELPALVESFGTQVLLWTRTWDTPPECAAALDAVRSGGVPTAFYHLDRWWGLEREYQVASQPFFQNMDVVFSPDGGSAGRWPEVGVRHEWLPPGVFETEALRPGRPNRAFPHRVVFVGTHPYPHAEWAPVRAAVINRLRAEFGRQFGLWPRGGRPVRGQRLNDLYASAEVVVGDSCLAGGATRYWSDRVPETLGRGGFLVHPAVEGLETWYMELPTYPVGDLDALVAVVRYWLDHPDERREVQGRLRELVLSRDTYRHRMETVLDRLDKLVGIPPPRAVGTLPFAEAACLPAEPQPARHVKTRQRGVFHLAEGNTDATAVREVWQDDTYRLLAEHVGGGAVVDVGANVGAFSVLAAKLGAREVHAYEPHPETFAVLEKNLAANGVAHVVHPLRRAVLDAESEVTLVGAGGGAHVGGGEAGGVTVRAVTLAEALSVAGGTVGEVKLLKLDCEGSEYRLLQALPDDSLVRVKRIVMEFHGPGMPHLTHLDADGGHLRRWGELVTRLAARGQLRIFGRPAVGGLLYWDRY